ncbi:hypothetical protein D3C84_519260 [compost metagenome]
MPFQLRDDVCYCEACITNEVLEADSDGGLVAWGNNFIAVQVRDQGLQCVGGIEQRFELCLSLN